MNRIKEIRLQKGISVQEMADFTGLNRSYIYNLERGVRNNPSLTVMEKIAESLGVSVEEVFFQNSSKSTPSISASA